MTKFTLRPYVSALLFVGLLGSTTLHPAFAQDDAVVATVNGQAITEGQLKLAENDLGEQFAKLVPDQKRAAALSAMIEIHLLADKAKADGLADKPDFKERMEFLQLRALHSAVVESEVSRAVADDALKARYDKEVSLLPKTQEVHARHILVATQEEADAIIKELDAGGNFEEIAKEKSTDGAAASGGDLGYFGPGQMVPAFEEAAFALEAGQYTKTPVKTQFGFHVIKVEDKRDRQPPAFEQAKEHMRSLVVRDKYLEMVKDQRANAKVEISDPALKSAVEAIDKGQPIGQTPVDGADEGAGDEAAPE